MTPPTPEQLIAEARKALTDVQVFPGDRWPNARDAERALLWDCHQQRGLKQESPWEGGTLAAAKLIAASPRLLTQLADALESALKERDEALTLLKLACDRDWDDEGLTQAATIASNAIYWRDEEIMALKTEIAKAREACPAVRMDRFADASILSLVNEQVSQLFLVQSRAEVAEQRYASALQRIQALERDAGQRKDEIAKLISEVLNERDKLEVMARRADRFLNRAEAAEQRIQALEQELAEASICPHEGEYACPKLRHT